MIATTTLSRQRVDLGDHSWVEIWPSFVLDDAEILRRLTAELPLAQESYRIHGRVVASPRLVAWHGDEGVSYAYSGTVHDPAPWTPTLSEIRAQVETTTGLSFNSVLVNLYRDGSDSMGWHSDREHEIGPAPGDRWIASISLGARRRFVLAHRTRRADRHVFALGAGDLLVMRGQTQTHYRHAVPKTRRVVGARLSLTFRHVLGQSAAPAPKNGKFVV